MCQHTLREGCADYQLNADTYIERMQFCLEAFDHHGNSVSLKEGISSPMIKMVLVSLISFVIGEQLNYDLDSVLTFYNKGIKEWRHGLKWAFKTGRVLAVR